MNSSPPRSTVPEDQMHGSLPSRFLEKPALDQRHSSARDMDKVSVVSNVRLLLLE